MHLLFLEIYKRSLTCSKSGTPNTLPTYSPWFGFMYYNLTTPHEEGSPYPSTGNLHQCPALFYCCCTCTYLMLYVGHFILNVKNGIVLMCICFCSISGPNTMSEWLIEGRRLIPLMPRLVPQTAFTAKANEAANMQAEKNASMPVPSLTGNKDGKWCWK